MTGFDIAVLLIVGFTAVAGFMRGLVQEVLALFAWICAPVARSAFKTFPRSGRIA